MLAGGRIAASVKQAMNEKEDGANESKTIGQAHL